MQLMRMQVHFLAGRPAGDRSGVRLALTDDRMPFSAGMLMYASSFVIPPGKASTLVPNHCCLRGFEPAHGFAFRVHTHALGAPRLALAPLPVPACRQLPICQSALGSML